ncbi:MAG: hypothetical protein JST88_08590, partial [Bacteroidetes bacterium]|nr:hypothetical protein [Bacteroidota bacterium]
MFSRNLLIAFAAYIFVLPANMYAQLNSPSVPCSKISWWTSDIPSKQPAASVNCSSTNPYLGTIYEDHTGVGIHVNYADGKSMSEPTWVYFLETEFINANGTINITVPNFPWWNNTYYLFNDADYFDPNQPPQFYLDHVTIATYGVGTYRFKIWDSKSPQLWGTIDIVVIPKIKRIWVEATPICENNYLPVSSSNAPSYSFKVKTEPPLTDIFSTGITDACFSVQPGIYDNVGNIVTSIPVQGISACHFNGGAWNYLTQQYPSIVDYSISGVDLWSFFHSTYPAPLMVKVIFDDDAIAQPAEMIYPLIINTSSAHIQNVIDPSDKAPAFHLNE